MRKLIFKFFLFAFFGIFAQLCTAQTYMNKSMVLKHLDKKSDWKQLNQTMMAISKQPELLRDADIRKILKVYANQHPFTIVRAAAQETLSNKTISPHLQRAYELAFTWQPEESLVHTINKTRSYCRLDGQRKSKLPTLPAFPKFEYSEVGQLGAPMHAVRDKHGWLVGYDAGEFGGGIIYYPDGALKGQILAAKYLANAMRIVEGDKKNTYWVLTGLHHMMGSEGIIYKVTIKGGHAKLKIAKRLPRAPYNSVITNSGDLFMDFQAPPTHTYNMKTKKEKLIYNPKINYNPPLLLTKSGILKSACEENAPEY